MNELDRKQTKIENVVKVLGLLLTGFIVAPFVFIAIKGLIGLIIAAAVSFAVINFLPYIAMKFANWKLAAMKAEASANPILTLENQYKEREEGLIAFRENIKTFHAEVQNFYSELEEQSSVHPELRAKFLEQYNKMKALLAMRSDKYKQAQRNLAAFNDVIEVKRSEWKLALAAAKMTKAAGVGEDFITKLLADTAISTVTTSLNTAFAELEVSLLDEQPVNVPPVVASDAKSEKVAPPTLDLDLVNESDKPQRSSQPRQKIQVG